MEWKNEYLIPGYGLGKAAGDAIVDGVQNGFFGLSDLVLPGSTFLDKTFDLTGKQAAQAQYDSQLALQQQAQMYNANEAEKAREWEKMMSDTAIQRQVADLKAAGLNPWLAISGSISGASAGSGASAQTSSGSAEMANNKIAQAAGLIAMALRIFLAKR